MTDRAIVLTLITLAAVHASLGNPWLAAISAALALSSAILIRRTRP